MSVLLFMQQSEDSSPPFNSGGEPTETHKMFNPVEEWFLSLCCIGIVSLLLYWWADSYPHRDVSNYRSKIEYSNEFRDMMFNTKQYGEPCIVISDHSVKLGCIITNNK